MRHPSQPPSAFYRPLEVALGTASTVRILRELCLHGGKLTAPFIAERVGLSRQGTLVAIKRLVSAGLLDQSGFGRSLSYQINDRHPLIDPLVNLFKRETERVDRVFREIRDYARQHARDVVSIWVYGSVARREDSPASDFDLMVILKEPLERKTADGLADRLEFLHAWGLEPSIASLTRRDLQTLASKSPEEWTKIREDAVVLHGRSPEELIDG